MIIPVRCISCNKVIGNKWNTYCLLLSKGHTRKQALDKLRLRRLCCRTVFICHFELPQRTRITTNQSYTHKKRSAPAVADHDDAPAPPKRFRQAAV